MLDQNHMCFLQFQYDAMYNESKIEFFWNLKLELNCMENFDLINLEYQWFLITLRDNIQNYLNSKLNWPNDDLINENSNKIKFSKNESKNNKEI